MLGTLFENLIYILFVIISVILHEFAHWYASYKLWDPTPKIMWRLSLNPKYHINLVWFVLFIILILLETLGIYWNALNSLWILVAVLFAKPVLIDKRYYKDPIKDELIVSLAWPFTNFILAIIWIIILFFFASLFWYENQPLILTNFLKLINYFIILNITLWAFNLLPIPPLDWFSILTFILDKFNIDLTYIKSINFQTIQLLFIFLLLWPFSWFVDFYLNIIINWFYNFFFTILSSIFY